MKTIHEVVIGENNKSYGFYEKHNRALEVARQLGRDRSKFADKHENEISKYDLSSTNQRKTLINNIIVDWEDELPRIITHELKD